MNNIRALRNKKGWTIRELADRMDTHFTTIARIERSESRLTREWAHKFAEALEVDARELIEGAGPMRDQLLVRHVPVIGLVAAGNWREAIGDTDEYTMSAVGGKNTFGLRVSGDSMDKIVPDGSIVLVDPDQSDLHDGRYFVVQNEEGDATFKQYRADPARLEPVSSNSEHQTLLLGRSPFKVVGRVIGATQNL